MKVKPKKHKSQIITLYTAHTKQYVKAIDQVLVKMNQLYDAVEKLKKAGINITIGNK